MTSPFAHDSPGNGVKPRPVTDHAVLRYLTRIEKFDIGPAVRSLGRGAPNKALAEAAAQLFGTTVEAIKAHICPPDLDALVATFKRVRRGRFVLVCAGGKVVTVVQPWRPKRKGVLSESEARRNRNRKHARGFR